MNIFKERKLDPVYKYTTLEIAEVLTGFTNAMIMARMRGFEKTLVKYGENPREYWIVDYRAGKLMGKKSFYKVSDLGMELLESKFRGRMLKEFSSLYKRLKTRR